VIDGAEGSVARPVHSKNINNYRNKVYIYCTRPANEFVRAAFLVTILTMSLSIRLGALQYFLLFSPSFWIHDDFLSLINTREPTVGERFDTQRKPLDAKPYSNIRQFTKRSTLNTTSLSPPLNSSLFHNVQCIELE
jgi:hypothetical protein